MLEPRAGRIGCANARWVSTIDETTAYPKTTPRIHGKSDVAAEEVIRRDQAPSLQGEGSLPRGVGPERDPARRARDAWPHGPARALREGAAARGRPHHGLAAHDHS